MATRAVPTRRARPRAGQHVSRVSREGRGTQGPTRFADQPEEAAREVSYLVDRLGSLLSILANAYRERGRSLTELGLDRLAERMVATVPGVSGWDEQVGPFYDTSGVMKILDVSRQSLNERVHRRTLLGLKTADGVLVYPTWQFRGDGLLRGLGEILGAFRNADADPWLVASWLTAPQLALEKMSVAEWLDHEGDVETARALARAAAGRWSQ